MYEELVKALRGCVLSKPCEGCPYYDPDGPSEKCATLNIAAADAIEEMNRRIDRAIELYNRNVEKSAMYEALAGISPEPPEEE